MTRIIEDGTGSGNKAKVDSKNRLLTDSRSIDPSADASSLGRAFSINTQQITLTNASETGFLYLKNNENDDFVITFMVYFFCNSTGGSGQGSIKVYRNPTGISSGTAVTSVNKNHSSSEILTSDIESGVTGSSLSGGTYANIETLLSAPSSARLVIGDVVLAKGNSIGWTIEPPTGNTSMVAMIALGGYLKESE